ncbi:MULTISPECIES: TetR/AcrR family transcriptional regulator [Nocardiaceae]|uniref:TetR/AcrR family transcriptional regulator n=1 Tax=Nocardiaceae TaxID=85025 RepID=UPI0005230831|nr:MULTISPECIES: TetR family transcriptional regulator [Rhodococcus]
MVEQKRGVERRDLITSAALRVIIARGVHATTHRAIAVEAGVPLGSLTYYFDGLTQLIEETFARLYDEISTTHRLALETVNSRDGAVDAVTDMICGTHGPSDEQLRAMIELYTYANHNSAAAEICVRWLQTTHDVLAPHFCEHALEALDALIEGWGIHQHFRAEPAQWDIVRAAVAAIAAAHDVGVCTK